MIDTICFFNRWHNGDIFSSREYVKSIQNMLPGLKYQFAHPYNPKLVADLRCEYININDIPAPQNITRWFAEHEIGSEHERSKDTVYVVGNTLYCNTWCGAYQRGIFNNHEHVNWPTLNHMWNVIWHLIDRELDVYLHKEFNPLEYVTAYDWSYYRTELAQPYVSGDRKIILFCNMISLSLANYFGDMKSIVERTAMKYPEYRIVCVNKFETHIPNITFTDDIFAGVEGGDLNEIAFLSTYADIIIGRMSGPFCYTHIQDNIFDSNVSYLCITHEPNDSYAYGVEGFDCRYILYTGKDEDTVDSIVNKLVSCSDEYKHGVVTIVS